MDLAAVSDARSMAQSPGVRRQPNIKALTSVRFFAALHVALYHMVRPFDRWGALAPVFGAGYVGVSFFFVLSGFILTYSHAPEYECGRGNARRFWVARIARIYPVYLLSLLLAAYVMRGQFVRKIHWIAFAADFVGMQSWSIRMTNFFNVPAWSISTEAFFYLVFPLVLMHLRPGSRKKAVMAVLGFWALAMAAPFLCLIRYPLQSWHEFGPPGPGANFVFRVRRLPLLALPEFLCGISLGWLYLKSPPTPRTGAILAWTGVLCTGAALLWADHLPFVMLHNGLLVPVFAMVILGLCRENGLSRLLNNNLLALLGEASFALYLIHSLFDTWCARVLGAPSTIPAALLELLAVIPISVLLHLCVERPCRRRILAWWARRHPSQLVIVPAHDASTYRETQAT